jgi:hypothetical protein
MSFDMWNGAIKVNVTWLSVSRVKGIGAVSREMANFFFTVMDL